MDTQNTSRQLRYLEEVRTPLHRAGFEILPVEGDQLPVHWNGTPLCRITGKGSVFYRREDAHTPQAEAALYRVEDIAAKTLEYMTAMEAAPQLKASGLDGDYRILAFLAPCTALFLVVYAYPLITIFLTSFCSWNYENFTAPEFLGWGHFFDNYSRTSVSARRGMRKKRNGIFPSLMWWLF